MGEIWVRLRRRARNMIRCCKSKILWLKVPDSIQGKDQELLQISQNTDGKTIIFPVADLEEVIPRIDSDGHIFLQVNFLSGKKITVLTENLIGFKPAPARGLDLGKLPKVVTTPDLLSVVEAIEDSITSEPNQPDEIEVLKRVFDSVLRGAEAVGFDITPEAPLDAGTWP